MACLDESMGFGFGAIGGAEQSINLGAIDWSPPPKRSHSARQMPPPRARQMPPSIVVDISPADARAAELVRQANCAVSTKIKIKPGTTKPLAAVYGKLRKRWRHVDGVLVLGAGPAPHSLKYAFVSPEHSCAPPEIIAPSPVSSLGSQSARTATPPNLHAASDGCSSGSAEAAHRRTAAPPEVRMRSRRSGCSVRMNTQRNLHV